MPDPATVAQRQQARPQGLMMGLVTLPFRLFGVLCGSLLLSILIECVGMHVFWPEQGWHHAQKLLTHELDQLSAHFKHSLVIQEPGRTACRWISYTYDKLFVQSGALERAREVSARAHAAAAAQPKRFTRLLSLAFLHLESYARAASFTLLTVLVRLLVLALASPLFCLAALAGLIDGLVRRDIRRFGAGHESGFVYHRARACITPISVLPGVLYLALPFSIHPLWILLPGATLLSIAVNVAAGSFKKYL